MRDRALTRTFHKVATYCDGGCELTNLKLPPQHLPLPIALYFNR